ncbi:hypothetical protein LOK49_LG09G01421 [Camellia lanceoleosa]|uniref:Uncharacterized protein n=1 Tax=Camellia lanceoleosa TaxID=1840588 RepID=A0ACC0GFJ7_9ERIC|nr:hypothetical protein LOK49_LG09G01421 [Camellia lanceoleosa]
MKKKWRLSTTTIAAVYMVLLILVLKSCPVLACPSDGSECRNCIVDRLKNGCPPCVPILRCMARCLWGGTSRSKCMKKCDCSSDGGYPRLADCKKCMSRCKCSCMNI